MCVNYHLVFRLGKTKKLLSIWFPAEPPVAHCGEARRRTGGKGAPVFGAAKRTLASEHRCAIGVRWTGGVA